ncbi:MAG: GNAT family N-acetyltransferase [Solirubrobacteraceae bacterium]
MVEVQFSAGAVDSGDGAQLAQAMREEIAELYEGLELDGPSMPLAGPAQLSAPGGAFLIGYVGAEPVCCGGLRRLDGRVCEVKKMYVVPSLRGRGVARALLDALQDEARRLGYAVARLDTGPRQGHAQALFESEGYRPIADFNGNPIATFWGERHLQP